MPPILSEAEGLINVLQHAGPETQDSSAYPVGVEAQRLRLGWNEPESPKWNFSRMGGEGWMGLECQAGGMEWHGMVWYGAVWGGMGRVAMGWYGMA